KKKIGRLPYILEYKSSFYYEISQHKSGVILYTSNSNQIRENEISRGGNTIHYHYPCKIV
ncbi:hypothetical protein LDENG_00006090, partial [Lucifuga dentata]